MAAKNKIKSRCLRPVSREESDLQDLMGLHFQACRRAEEVDEQIQELLAAGKYPEARVMQMHAAGIQQGLRALEAEVRLATRAARATPGAAENLLLEQAARSFDPDFEATMDPRITFEVPR